MGKTLLARRILEGLEEEVFEAMLLVMLPGAADATGILQRFARQLGCEEPATERAGLLGQIYEHLAIVREDGRHAVLIVDDAQVMAPEVFAELSGLLSLEYEDRRLISMLFVGSPELDKLVQNDASIMPRVDIRVRLQPLDMENASAYLTHRITAVKGNPEIVPSAAMDALYKFGRGRPRLLNTLADNALFEAYLSGRSTIDASDVERAAADLGIGPDPGTTYSQRSTAEVPPSPAISSVPPDLIAPQITPPTLDIDEPVADLERAEPIFACDAQPTLDLDQGLEDALGDFNESPPEEATILAPIAEFEFESEPPTMTSLPFADAEPILEAEPFEGEGEFLLAEAELTPLEMGGAEILDDAFVELLEE
jgi:type II secretory pathway predicted ATPase ExeA